VRRRVAVLAFDLGSWGDAETPLKCQCRPNMPARKIARSTHEAARDKARAIAKTEAYSVSHRQRKEVECSLLI
jgi:hypothetical protein